LPKVLDRQIAMHQLQFDYTEPAEDIRLLGVGLEDLQVEGPSPVEVAGPVELAGKFKRVRIAHSVFVGRHLYAPRAERTALLPYHHAFVKNRPPKARHNPNSFSRARFIPAVAAEFRFRQPYPILNFVHTQSTFCEIENSLPKRQRSARFPLLRG
jgi:hypothetical protein